MTTRRLPPRRVAIGASVALLGILVFPHSARADQISDKRAQAARIASQIDALGLQESALSEQYDKAVLDEQSAATQVASARDQLRQAAAAETDARRQVRQVAIDAYTGGGESALAQQAGGGVLSAQDQLLRSAYTEMLASNRQDVVDRYRAAALQANTAEAQLSQAQRQAAARVDAVRAATASVKQAQAQLQATYAQVNGQLATLVAHAQAAEEARREQQAQAALARQRAAQQAQLLAAQQAQSRAEPVAAPDPAGAPNVAAVPIGRGGAVAVQAAETRLGDPYVWGAAGPDSFDCSGLTMWAWAHAGVSLPHYSGAQYAATTHIPMSDLQPGDLVFFADPGEHEAMYIGNGQIIEAPHTGADVRIMPLYSQFVQASRP